MAKEVAGDVPGGRILGMLEDLECKLRKGVITEGQLGRFLRKENPFATPASKVGEYEEFYRDVFGQEIDLSNLVVPPERDGFGWLVVVADGLTLNKVYKEIAKRMPHWPLDERLG